MTLSQLYFLKNPNLQNQIYFGGTNTSGKFGPNLAKKGMGGDICGRAVLQPECFQRVNSNCLLWVGALVWAVGGNHGLAMWMGLRHCCVSMPVVWEQGALAPAHGDSPGCKG